MGAAILFEEVVDQSFHFWQSLMCNRFSNPREGRTANEKIRL